MDLIKENLIKHRSVYGNKNFIRKYWHNKSARWVRLHAITVASIVPDYILDVGVDCSGPYIDMYILPGITADKFEHTDEFIKRIYNFCLQNIKDTQPYVHGDWVLSNIIINGDEIGICDWDNIGVYPEEEVMKKLQSDMLSAFGDKFLEVINDTPSI